MTSGIFDGLLSLVQPQAKPANPLIVCLKFITEQLKIAAHQGDETQNLSDISFNSLEDYEKSIGIIFHPATLSSLDKWPASDYPLLIEDNHTGNSYVFLKKKGRKPILFNPLSAKNEYVDVAASIVVSRSWQCVPGCIPTQAGYAGLIKFILHYLRKNFITAVILGSLVASATLIVSIMSGFILSYQLEMHAGYNVILYGALFLFCLGTAWLQYANGLFVKSINANVLFIILPNIVNHVFNLPLQVTRRFVSSDLSQRLFDYETAVQAVIRSTLSLFFHGTSVLILLIYMTYCSAQLALLYLIICVMFTAIKIVLFPKNIKNLTSQLSEQSKLNSFLVEALLKIQTLRSANAENETFNLWLQKLIRSKVFSELVTKIELMISALDIALPVILLLCVYTILYRQSATSPSYDLIQFMICAGQFAAVFQKLSTELTALIQFLPGLNRLDALMAEKVEENQSGIAMVDFKQQLTVSDVCLQNGGNYLLEDISLTIPAGKFIAIVGRSGAGKSTLFRVILGLEPRSTGSILIDNYNITNINIKDWRKQFGVVLQNTNLFPGSIFSNIAANTAITLEEAWRLAHCVGLDEEINNMPMKMFTYISDNAGESLSGGQKQKILIARALATRPKILLLDEATSALDNHSQARIHSNLNALAVTRIVIAHRYSTIMDADSIYVMEKGKIIDCGTYHELSLRNSLPRPLGSVTGLVRGDAP